MNLAKNRRPLRGYDRRYRIFSDFSLFTKSSWIEGNQFFRELAHSYPNSKFILNNRSTESWISSRRGQKSTHVGNPLQRSIEFLADPSGNLSVNTWRKQKEYHEGMVREFFANQPERFIEFDISDPGIPAKIDDFLSVKFNHSLWAVVGRGNHK